jgi:hypothetical protein
MSSRSYAASERWHGATGLLKKATEWPPLDEYRTESECRCVALDGKKLGEVRHGEDRGGRDGSLERCECCGHRVIPGETLLLE